jgi:hypothetical protein
MKLNAKTTLFLIIVFTVFSCKKDVKNTPTNNSPSPVNAYYMSSFPSYLTDPSNSSNPYDSFGDLHNRGLHYVLNHMTVLNSENMLLHIQDFARTEFNDNSINFIDTIIKFNNDSIKFSWQDNYNPSFNVVEAAMERGLISDTCYNYYNNFLTISSHLTNTDKLTTVINECIDLETEIQSATITDTEKELLLRAASVLRYSAAYWTSIAASTSFINMTSNINDDFPSWLQGLLNKKSNVWDEQRTCREDFGGFCTGFIAGWYGGPHGALAGGMLGMVGTSSVDIFKQWQGWGVVHPRSGSNDPHGTEWHPSIDAIYSSNNVEVRLATIMRPDLIQIVNVYNTPVIEIDSSEIQNFTQNIDVSGLSSGTYTVKAITNVGTFEKSFDK